MWLQIAADRGEDVSDVFESVSAKLEERQIKLARQQASAWQAQHHGDASSSLMSLGGFKEPDRGR
jgi:hypothetical protein